MEKVKVNENDYELIKNYKDGFNLDVLNEKYTSYFDDYDYILGDWSYGKLRLKGFCDKDNKMFKNINDINVLDDYIKKNGAYDCKYFVLKKIK